MSDKGLVSLCKFERYSISKVFFSLDNSHTVLSIQAKEAVLAPSVQQDLCRSEDPSHGEFRIRKVGGIIFKSRHFDRKDKEAALS